MYKSGGNVARCAFTFCGVLSILVGLFLIILKFFLLENLIKELAADGVAMSNDTYNLWGVIPGDTQTFTLRNFSIFNFSNPHQFLYALDNGKAVIPQFTEIAGFLYQEKSQFLNTQYSEDQSEISFDYWLYFDLLNGSRNVDEKYTVVNVAPLGFWYQLQTTPVWSFSLQGFGGLFVQMNQTIKLQAIGQGVQSIFFPNYQIFKQYCFNEGFQEKQCWNLWSDPRFGLFRDTNYLPWVKSAYINDQSSKSFLYTYFFPLPKTNFDGLLEQIKRMCISLDKIISNHYCGFKECSTYEMTIKQIAGAGITSNPPSGDPQQSICTSNVTCIGSPQITTFLHHEFKQKNPDQKYQQLIFSEQSIANLFTPYKNLLNIGFLEKLYRIGFEYDKDSSEDLLQNMQALLDVQTIDHAFVLWQWIKYMTNNFVLKNNKGGTRKLAGLGAVSSQAIWQVSNQFASVFLQDIYSFLAYQEVKDCMGTLRNFLTESQATSICSTIDEDSYISYYQLISPCLEYSKGQSFSEKHGLNSMEFSDYCDMDEQPSNIGKILLDIISEVGTFYACTQSYFNKCTVYDIAVKQILSSDITRDPFPSYPRKKTLTAHSWFQEIPTFQYLHFLSLAQVDDPQNHTEADMRDLFTFDKLLNGPAVQQLFLENNSTVFAENYHWENGTLLRNYLRYVTIEVGFGGFTQQRSAKELFFGYTDPFLQNLKETDTMMGGDPSIQAQIAFNELNITQEEAKLYPWVMKTGLNNSLEVRQFTKIFDKPFITYNQTYFTGQEVKWEMVSPWQGNVTIEGTDGFQTPPNIKATDTPSAFITSIDRYSPLDYNRSLHKFGFELYDFRIQDKTLQSKFDNPQNAKYYQTYTSLLNSTYQGFPLMISKTHFLDADPSWSKKIKLIDPNNNPIQANEWDDTRLYVEPYTGTSFSATICLQSNYLHFPDILFPSSELTNPNSQLSFNQKEIPQNMLLLPIVNTFRSGNISENGVNAYFSDLRWIIDARRGFALLGFLIVGFVAFSVVLDRVRVLYTATPPNKKQPMSLLESQAMNEND